MIKMKVKAKKKPQRAVEDAFPSLSNRSRKLTRTRGCLGKGLSHEEYLIIFKNIAIKLYAQVVSES